MAATNVLFVCGDNAAASIMAESVLRSAGGARFHAYSVGIRPAAPEHAEQAFEQLRCGLHHLCFRARERADVDAVHTLVLRLGARVVHGPQEDGWVPGYYSVLFEDPDGIRLEVNHVPGKGVFDPGVKRLGSA